MDGNGRWADRHGKTRQFGHEQGSSNVYDIFLSCIELDINTVTFFAMSSENMNRSKEETEFISILLDDSIKKILMKLVKYNNFVTKLLIFTTIRLIFLTQFIVKIKS